MFSGFVLTASTDFQSVIAWKLQPLLKFVSVEALLVWRLKSTTVMHDVCAPEKRHLFF
jgi:hypothetical protein